jgi:hypothetical protein
MADEHLENLHGMFRSKSMAPIHRPHDDDEVLAGLSLLGVSGCHSGLSLQGCHTRVVAPGLSLKGCHSQLVTPGLSLPVCYSRVVTPGLSLPASHQLAF